jgi:hypothetical protein
VKPSLASLARRIDALECRASPETWRVCVIHEGEPAPECADGESLFIIEVVNKIHEAEYDTETICLRDGNDLPAVAEEAIAQDPTTPTEAPEAKAPVTTICGVCQKPISQNETHPECCTPGTPERDRFAEEWRAFVQGGNRGAW